MCNNSLNLFLPPTVKLPSSQGHHAQMLNKKHLSPNRRFYFVGSEKFCIFARKVIFIIKNNNMNTNYNKRNSYYKNSEPRSIGKFIFYELNNPIQPIEIECQSVRSNDRIFITTKHNDKSWDNYAVQESILGGAGFYYFTLPTGKIFCTLPIYIKNNILIYDCMGVRNPKIVREYWGALVGIRGIFNEISWLLKNGQITGLKSIQLTNLRPIDQHKTVSVNGNNCSTIGYSDHCNYYAINSGYLKV